MRRTSGRRGPWLVLFALAILLALAVRGWAATQWAANFQSDEAIFGLMARHIVAGEFTFTNYGPPYFGSIESIISAGLISLLGPSVLSFRLSALLLLAGFLTLHAIFTSRHFGYPVAFASLMFLALPGFHVLNWTYQPIGAYEALLTIGTAMLIVGDSRPRTGRGKLARFACLGLLTGIGLWSNHEIVFYAAPLGLVLFLGTPEWHDIYASLRRFADDFIQIPFVQLIPVVVVGMLSLFILAFFSNACSPVGLYAQVQSISRMLLASVLLVFAGWIIWTSRRRPKLALDAASMLVGFAVGYSPSLYNWIALGNSPYWAVYPSCPTGVVPRANLMLKQILPGLWGIPTWDRLQATRGASLIAWGAVAILVLAALVSFAWWNRLKIWRLVTVTPSDDDSRPVHVVFLLFSLPLFISLLADNTVDVHSIRHALVSAQASAIIFAAFAVWLVARFRRAGMLVLALWLAFVGLANLTYANSNWLVKFTHYEPKELEALGSVLAQNNIQYAYADYWGAYTLDYLLQEQVIIAPFNGIDRYPRYSRLVASAPKIAFIFPTTNAPPATGKVEDLIAFLSDADNPQGEGTADASIRERLAGQDARAVQHVADWDVWIVAEN
jgi:hypothetical protein